MVKKEKKVLMDNFKAIDMFGQQPGFLIKGKDTYPSFCGAFISLIILAFSLAYVVDRSLDLYEYEETSFE